MKRLPSDFKLLKAIYKRHRADYGQITQGGLKADVLVPVDIVGIAHTLGVDTGIVFGRLYYHLDPKYGYEPDPKTGVRKVFFTPVAGDDVNCVNFPLLEAVLAGLWEQRRRDLWVTFTADRARVARLLDRALTVCELSR
jgi:hypothetical protein